MCYKVWNNSTTDVLKGTSSHQDGVGHRFSCRRMDIDAHPHTKQIHSIVSLPNYTVGVGLPGMVGDYRS